MKNAKSLATLLLAGAALVAPLGVGVSSAAAAPATTHTVAAAPAANLPVYRTWYWTWANCDNAGRQGVERGHWDQYQCAEGDVFWHLWTNR
ncbi:hypothetical protein ACIQOU_15435 [Streptomyces sp. NPDC091279]|uniref:hypothetical protein n=1 Tax=unclassified Streptomyces TaxID=2593676 RepID=UPI0038024CEA